MNNTEIIRQICERFEINFLTLQDILNANHPTKIEESEKHIVLILKIFKIEKKKNDGNKDIQEGEEKEKLQQQVCIILGNNFILTFLEEETDFFDDVINALRNDILKIRQRQSDYLFSVLLNSVMSNYISTVSFIEDALEDLEEEMLNITGENKIGIQIQTLRREYMMIKKTVLPLKEIGRASCRERV